MVESEFLAELGVEEASLLTVVKRLPRLGVRPARKASTSLPCLSSHAWIKAFDWDSPPGLAPGLDGYLALLEPRLGSVLPFFPIIAGRCRYIVHEIKNRNAASSSLLSGLAGRVLSVPVL